METKSKLLLLSLCCIICSVVIVIMAAADNETQSPKEIAQIQAANEEYDRTHPKPKTSPRALISSWVEYSTDDISTDIGTTHADNEIVVYTDEKTNTYHLGLCEAYEKQSGADYSNPQWLVDVVLSGTRCSLCIPDEMFHTCREAVFRQEIQEQESELKAAKKNVVNLIALWVLTVILFSLVIIELKRRIRKQSRDQEKRK